MSTSQGERTDVHDPSTSRLADRRRRTRLASLGLLAIVGVLAAGCGQNSTGTSTGTRSGPSDRGKAMLAYASCMRAHGVPDFPDPKRVSGGWELSLTQAIAESPQYQRANQGPCRMLQPGAGGTSTISAQERERALKFAACMRSHGVPSYPDPTFENGNVTFNVPAQRTDQVQFEQADKQCARFRHGQGGR